VKPANKIQKQWKGRKGKERKGKENPNWMKRTMGMVISGFFLLSFFLLSSFFLSDVNLRYWMGCSDVIRARSVKVLGHVHGDDKLCVCVFCLVLKGS